MNLSENKIGVIEGLENNIKLHTLSIASNNIRHVTSVLFHLSNLTELNLSNNYLSSFDELRNLSRLKSLKILFLNDPHYGRNPVCNLCNYHTYTLYHLQYLTILDSIRLSSEAVAVAEATYLKKQMYYNMRVKTCKRSSTSLVRIAEGICQTKLDVLKRNSKRVTRLVKSFDRELQALEEEAEPIKKKDKKVKKEGKGPQNEDDSGSDSDESFSPLGLLGPTIPPENKTKHDNLMACRTSCKDVLARLDGMRDGLNARLHLFRCQMADRTEELVERMLLEMKSGGNVRLEDGSLTDSWYQSCVQFIRSHFCAPEDIRPRVAGLRINRVTKIHNRLLRNGFEQHLECMPQFDPTGEDPVRPELHYLFVGDSAKQPHGLLRAAQDGFADPKELLANQHHGAVVSSNNAAQCDLERLSTLAKQRSRMGGAGGSKHAIDEAPPASSCVLVAKVFLGNAGSRKGGRDSSVPVKQQSYPGLHSVHDELGDILSIPLPRSRSSNTSTVKEKGKGKKGRRRDSSSSRDSDSKAERDRKNKEAADKDEPREAPEPTRLCYVFEPLSVLPEYIINYDYIWREPPPEGTPAEPLQLVSAPMVEQEKAAKSFVGLRGPLGRFLTSELMASSDSHIDSFVDQALANIPELPTYQLSDIPALSRPTNMELTDPTTLLNLHDMGLRAPPDMLHLTSLRTLVLAFNRLAQLPDLSNCTSLVHLDCGHNEISSVQGLASLPALKYLHLNSNRLFTLQTVLALSRSAPQLIFLDLSSNNVLCGRSGYKGTVIKSFPDLEILDNVQITQTQREGAATDVKQELDDQLIMDHCFISRDSPEFEALVPPQARVHTNQYSRVRISDFLRLYKVTDWTRLVREVELDHQRLKRICKLTRFTQLYKASFCDNELTEIQGLETVHIVLQTKPVIYIYIYIYKYI